MVRKLTIGCTQCRQVSDLFLTNDAHVVIFSCPSCGAPLLSYHGRLVVLTENDVDGIRCGNGHEVIGKILRRLGEHDSPAVYDEPGADGFHVAAPPASVGAAGCPPRCGRITDDDLIDLHFALADCADVEEFISRL